MRFFVKLPQHTFDFETRRHATIKRHERSPPGGAAVVNHPREMFLAGSRRTGEQRCPDLALAGDRGGDGETLAVQKARGAGRQGTEDAPPHRARLGEDARVPLQLQLSGMKGAGHTP